MLKITTCWIIISITIAVSIHETTAQLTTGAIKQNDEVILPSTDLNTTVKLDIPVNIQIHPMVWRSGQRYISTGDNITLKAEVFDPLFHNVTPDYQWSTKSGLIARGINASHISYKFKQAEPNQFIKLYVLYPDQSSGSDEKTVTVRDPISLTEHIGKTFLEHGELLDLTIKFLGTGPYSFCYKICHNNSFNIFCQPACEPEWYLEENQFPIVRYLPLVGNYTLFIAIDNVASKISRSFTIRVLGTIKLQTIPYIPIISSILAVLILLTGVALHQRFKRTIYTETADFDFVRQIYDDSYDDNIWDEEQSFLQRVKCILLKNDWQMSNNKSEPNVNSRTRLLS